ncbi:hypothetical protein TWF102_003332 [Orbilia oligospora]|uniref:Kelch repeat protein n=1 Tax=Orbilia oligospora TaxID=2813651 RepID=A0A7C8MUJ7_ORBOL|nr:hypothetical protein TWF102_003332 [Orbilia oligospora]KAF3113209.1 hypothetical protein TWF103_002383 [Orbilia oligospora]
MAQNSPYKGDPFSTYCALSGQQTLFLGEKLFITGGYYVRTPNRTVSAGPWFRILDLQTSFELDRLRNYTEILPPSVYPPTVPIVQNPVFWFDSQTSSIFYSQGAATLEGGIYNVQSQHNSAVRGKSWTAPFNPANNSLGLWREIDTPFSGQTGPAVSRRSFYDDKARKGYIYGGWIAGVGPDVVTDGALTYDAETLIWTNGTIPYGRMDGQGAGVPYRTADGRVISIIFGGRLNGTPLSMTTIFIHDITSNKWYRQDSNGGDPGARGFFCSTMVSAPDNSSHQILVYSGVPPSGPSNYTDIWALSLPSFTWSLIQADSPILAPGPGPRLHASCDIVNNHILAVFGGRNFNGGDSRNCDTDGNALFLYNLNTFEWLESYDSSDREAYRVPGSVFNDIGGNSSGFATLTSPPGGFSDPEMTTLFALTTPTSPAESGGESNKNVGAIAGGTVAGVVVVIGLALLIFFVRRRRPQPLPTPPVGDDPRKNTINGAFEIGNSNEQPQVTLYSGALSGGEQVMEVQGREVKPAPPPVELPAENLSNASQVKNNKRERRPLLS